MEAKELRPTNSVYRLIFDGKKVVDKRIVNFSTADYNYLAFFQPVQITEEILLKAGFELSYKSEFTIIYNCISDHRFSYKFNLVENKSWLEYHGGAINCNELHHLQNIVYDLTGKELEIKL